MKTTSLEILEKAELPPAQAHAILKVMESEMSAAHEPLATKADLMLVKADLMVITAEIKADLRILTAEMDQKFGQMEGKLFAIEGKLSRWVLTCILGQTAVLAGFGYFLLAHWAR